MFPKELNCFWRVKLNMTGTLKKQHKLNSKSGMSILEVTISIGIMGIMALSFASMMTEQAKQQKRLELKLAQNDTKTILITALKNGNVCTAQFSNTLFGAIDLNKNQSGTLNLSDAAVDKASAAKLSVNKVYLGDVNTSQVAIIKGEKLPGATGGLISDIFIGNLKRTTPTDDTTYTGDLIVSIDSNSSGLGTIKPITVRLNITTTNNPDLTQRKIASCDAGDAVAVSNSTAEFTTITQDFSTPGNHSFKVPALPNDWSSMKAKILVIGAGGGGGGAWGSTAPKLDRAASGGGGGAGQIIKQTISVTPGETLSIYIGGGGLAGGATNNWANGCNQNSRANNGYNGQATLFKSSSVSVAANPGLGGSGGICGAAVPGGSTGGGTESGFAGQYFDANSASCIRVGGNGGSLNSLFKGGMGGVINPHPAWPLPGSNGAIGAGGGGGSVRLCESGIPALQVSNGGMGGNGYVKIIFFDPSLSPNMTDYLNLVEQTGVNP